MATRLAGHGFLVAVPEVYHEYLPPRCVLGYDDAGKERGNRLKYEKAVRAFDDDAQASQEVLNGNAHGWMASAPRPKFLALDNPDVAFMPFAENLTKGDESIAMRKGDPDTLNWVNNWVLFYTSNGWLEERNAVWFQNRDWKDKVAKN